MVFRASLVNLQTGSTVSLRVDGNTIFGRGPRFGINDRRVSRKHAEITLSSTSKSITIRPLSVIPSYITRNGEAIALEKDNLLELKDGDKLSLLAGVFEFALQIEEEAESKEVEEFSEDATQLDIDQIEELERKNHSTKRNRDINENATNSSSSNNNNNGTSLVKRHKMGEGGLTSSPSAVLIGSNELTYIKTIGTGSCGEVYEANWKGTRVAVKKIFRTLLHGSSVKEFQMETEMLRRLRHPCIVLFMGTCSQGREMSIVTEFIERGSLREVLSNENIVLEWNVLLNMAMDAAKGMNYLHTYSPPIIHRDLKSYNLLVDTNFRVKVTDFGLAKFNVENDITNTFCGTLPWTAPEVFRGTGYSEKCDIYSYGVVLWELITRKEPYSGMNKPDIIVGVSQKGLRPIIPDNCPLPYSQLITDCWKEEPSQRPSFSEILHRLEQLLNMLPKNTPNSSDNSSNSNGTSSSSVNMSMTPMNLTQQFHSAGKVQINNNWEISPQDIEIQKEIIEGTTATIYKGIYKEQQVAIKILKESLDGKHKEDFSKEIAILSRIKSPYVVSFIGVCYSPKLAIITELLSNGSLFDIMNRTDISYNWELVIQLCIESATAINTLHTWTPAVVHRDIKSTNLLLDNNLKVKISEVGLARFYVQENNNSLVKLKGGYIYAAPENYNGNIYTTKSDVYSFAIILWELVTRCITGSYVKPYSEYKNLKWEFQIMIQTAKNGLRPSIHSSCPSPFADLIQRCWQQDPDKRPSFTEILATLYDIKKLFESEQSRRSQ